MAATLDLSRAHLSRTYGDLTAVFSWFNDHRALFLIPTHRARAPWFVVLEPAAHEWNDQSPDDLRRVIPRAVKACDVLGVEPTPRNVKRLVSIVNDSIADLVRMPSAPPPRYLPGNYGALQVRADGQAINEEPIKLETGGATYG